MSDYPDTLPDQGIITQAVEDILAYSFSDKLNFGAEDYPLGTHRVFKKDADRTLEAAKAARRRGDLTYTHLLLCQTFATIAQTKPSNMRLSLVSLASLALDAIEQIDRDFE